MADDKHLTHEEKVEKVRSLIKDSNVGTLTTNTPKGLVSRPMAIQDIEFDGDVWFLTTRDSEKVTEIQTDPNVNVAFSDSKRNFVSLTGKAEIREDQAKKEEIWNKVFEQMFNTDVNDPNIVLIKVHADSAEYWESGGVIKSVFAFVKGLMSDDDAEDLGENETVHLP